MVESYNVDEVKRLLRNRWADALSSLTGIQIDYFKNKHNSCPRCGEGKDRFRFTDLDGDGSAVCTTCCPVKAGDGFATMMWLTGRDFPTVLRECAEWAGVSPSRGGAKRRAPLQAPSKDPATSSGPDPAMPSTPFFLAESWSDELALIWCLSRQGRGITLDGLKSCGAEMGKHYNEHVLGLPMRDAAGKTIGHCIYNLTGGTLRAGSGADVKWVKIKTDWNKACGWIGTTDRLADCDIVWKVEGVSDCLALASILPANHAVITNPHGSEGDVGGKHSGELVGQLAGKHVRIIHDADFSGDTGSKKWASAICLGGAASVTIVRLPYPIVESHGQDIRDYLTSGSGDFETLQSLASNPSFSTKIAAEDIAKQSNMPPPGVISNAVDKVGEDGSLKAVPISMKSVLLDIREKTAGWPKRVQNQLFIDESETHFIKEESSLFGWLAASVGPVVWRSQLPGAVSRREVFCELCRTSENFKAVESLPHEPLIPGYYYTKSANSFELGDGSKLSELVYRFEPLTPIDQDLILSAFLTPCWGGPPGRRPCFVITSDDGRGVGKTTLAEMIGFLFGGMFTAELGEDIQKLKTRLLTNQVSSIRVGLLDNIKSHRFSWAELEGLITASDIDGHQMYVGNSSRPNLITWYVTLNGASLSTDMAQRAIVIKIKRPTSPSTWFEQTKAFVEANRAAIIGDCLAILRSESKPLAKSTRWASWERGVLSKLPDPAECQAVIEERQSSVDVEGDELDIVQDYFRSQLESLHYETDTTRVFIPTKLAAQWYNDATQERKTTVAVGRILTQFANERKKAIIKPTNGRRYGRGFIWWPEGVEQDSRPELDIEEKLNRKKLFD